MRDEKVDEMIEKLRDLGDRIRWQDQELCFGAAAMLESLTSQPMRPVAEMNPEGTCIRNMLDECIDEMVEVFGIDSVIEYCKLSTWKYRKSAAEHPEGELDRMKADWFMKALREMTGGCRYVNEDWEPEDAES